MPCAPGSRSRGAAARRTSMVAVGACALTVTAWACAVGYTEAPTDEPFGTATEADSGKVPTATPTASTDAGQIVIVDSGVEPKDAGAGDSGAPPPSCKATNTCMVATTLAAVSGDTGSTIRNATGEKSEWLVVRITEDDNSVIGAKLRAKVELTSTPSSNYDLFVYVPGSDKRECTSVTKSSTSTGTTDTVSVDWGEGSVANGGDDSRPITIEVRHVSGLCDASHKWTLKVTGNN